MSDPLPDHVAAYAPLTAYAAPARATAEPWRLLAVLVLWVILQDLAHVLLTEAVRAWYGPVFGMVALANLTYGVTPLGVTGSLWLSLPMGGAFLLALALVTGRGLPSLLGPLARLPRDLAAGFAPLCLVGLARFILPADPALTPAQAPATVLAWAPLALPGMVVTAAASEMIFRGFLQQQLAARWQASWVWMGLPAALFALLQGAPAAVGDLAALSILWSLAFSAACADLTARTGGLGAAIGLQAAMLAQGIFLVGLKGPMNGLALQTLDLGAASALPWLGLDFLMLAVGWLSARLALRV